jgi:hypothetical protein
VVFGAVTVAVPAYATGHGYMRTEAYTWVVCVEVAVAAASIQIAGLLADRPGGLPWVFLYASVAAGIAAAIAAMPGGPIARAASTSFRVRAEGDADPATHG